MTGARPDIVIAGAGTIGCFAGGALVDHGSAVKFLARPRILKTVAAHGLTVTDMDGYHAHFDAGALAFSEDPAILSDADIVLVCVKSGATAKMGNLIAQHTPQNAVVVSLQNGVNNADILRSVLPGRDVRAGMVPYNVVNAGEGRFHRGVAGAIVIEAGAGDIAEKLTTPNFSVHESSDIRAVQWGKLLINLNNALNALSDLPLRDELLHPGWRGLLADQINEALPALKAAGIEPKAALPLPIKMLPTIMRLPTPLYKIVAGRSLKIDPEARSSMWEDLQLRRKTEIDELQGAVVELCKKQNLSAPVNARVADLIRQSEDKADGSPGLTPQDVRAGL